MAKKKKLRVRIETTEIVRKVPAVVHKTTEEVLPVSKLALMRRINRKLAKRDERLYARRGGADDESGDYYVLNIAENKLVEAKVNPEEKARELGVLQDWEVLQEEAYEKGREEGYEDGFESGKEENREGVDGAYEKGYEDGFEKGREVGQEEGRVEEDE